MNIRNKKLNMWSVVYLIYVIFPNITETFVFDLSLICFGLREENTISFMEAIVEIFHML